MKNSILHFVLVAAPKVFGGVCTLVFNIILLRYLGPDQFGILALCLAAVLLSDAILGSAVDMGVMRLASQHQAQSLQLSLAFQKTAIYLKAGVLMAAAAAILAFGQAIAQRIFGPAGSITLPLLSLAAASTMLLLRSAQVHLQLSSRFGFYGALDLLQNVLKFGGIALLLSLNRAAPARVLVWFGVGPAAAAGIWFVFLGRHFLRVEAQWKLAKELLVFIKWFLFIFSLAACISRLDVFLLAKWTSLSEVGIFSAGQTVAWVPQLLGAYLGIVVSPKVMPLWQERKLGSFFWRFQLGMLLTGTAIYIVAIYGMSSFRWLLPPAFARSEAVIMALLPGALAGLITFPLTITLLMFLRPKFLFIMDCISLPLLLALYRYAIPQYGALGAAWVTSAANVVRAGVAQVVAWQCARQNEVMPELALAPVIGPADPLCSGERVC